MHAMSTLTFIVCIIILYYIIMCKAYYHLNAGTWIHYVAHATQHSFCFVYVVHAMHS